MTNAIVFRVLSKLNYLNDNETGINVIHED